MKITDISKFLIGDTLVGSIYIGSTKVWSSTTPPGPEPEDPILYDGLRVTAVGGPINVGWLKHFSSAYGKTWYSLDGSTWNEWDYDNNLGTQITLQPGKHLYFRGTHLKAATASAYRALGFLHADGIDTGYVKVGGNPLSLCYTSESAMNSSNIPSTPSFNYALCGLFDGSLHPGSPYTMADHDPNLLKDASELVMPYNFNGKTYVCRYMFNERGGLVKAPELPATQLTLACYVYMFTGCSALVNAPELPATNLANQCYQYMFQNCSSLVIAPELPATTLYTTCYMHMFTNSGVVEMPTLPRFVPGQQSCDHMFYNCNKLKVLKPMTVNGSANQTFQYMFSGCTSIEDTGDILTADKVGSSACAYMFQNCTSLKRAKFNVKEITFNTSGEISGGCFTSMFNGCSSLNEIHHGITNLSSTQTYIGKTWVSGVSTSGKMIGASAFNIYGDGGIPNGWTYEVAPYTYDE